MYVSSSSTGPPKRQTEGVHVACIRGGEALAVFMNREVHDVLSTFALLFVVGMAVVAVIGPTLLDWFVPVMLLAPMAAGFVAVAFWAYELLSRRGRGSS